MSQPKILNTVLGAGGFGVWEFVPKIQGNPQDYLDEFKRQGFSDLDTAIGYGTSESVIGELQLQKQGFNIDTKFKSFYPGAHAADKIKESAQTSLKNLQTNRVRILYLHAPDVATPFEETLKAVNEVYQQGSFEKFGLSNYSVEQVEEIIKICKEKNYVLPTVYQGNYNAITRKNEEKLFPLLRKNKISFYAYSPLAAGFFAQKKEQKPESGGRYDQSFAIGAMYTSLYAKDSMYKALEKLSKVTEKHGITNIEAAIRWIYHHSLLRAEEGDSVIIGASKLYQLKNTIDFARKGPLPKEIVDTFEQIWQDVKIDAPSYHM